MKSLLPIALSLCLLTGCSLIPKPVEFFQDKVHKFPQPTASQIEYQKEAALRAKQKAAATVDAALSEGSTTNVVAPAREAEKLTDAVSTSLGPPVHEAQDTDVVVGKLQTAVARHDNKVDAFQKYNDKDAGKKIEGTGAVSIPYFVYLGVVVLIIVVLWHLGKIALTAASMANPGAAVGLGVVNAGSALAAKGFSQVVSGGEDFLKWVDGRFSAAEPKLATEIADTFKALHKQNQDQDVQSLVNTIK